MMHFDASLVEQVAAMHNMWCSAHDLKGYFTAEKAKVMRLMQSLFSRAAQHRQITRKTMQKRQMVRAKVLPATLFAPAA